MTLFYNFAIIFTAGTAIFLCFIPLLLGWEIQSSSKFPISSSESSTESALLLKILLFSTAFCFIPLLLETFSNFVILCRTQKYFSINISLLIILIVPNIIASFGIPSYDSSLWYSLSVVRYQLLLVSLYYQIHTLETKELWNRLSVVSFVVSSMNIVFFFYSLYMHSAIFKTICIISIVTGLVLYFFIIHRLYRITILLHRRDSITSNHKITWICTLTVLSLLLGHAAIYTFSDCYTMAQVVTVVYAINTIYSCIVLIVTREMAKKIEAYKVWLLIFICIYSIYFCCYYFIIIYRSILHPSNSKLNYIHLL